MVTIILPHLDKEKIIELNFFLEELELVRDSYETDSR
jgi:hypothetical protein